MELYAILIASSVALVTLAVLLKINLKTIKLIKEIGGDSTLNEITNVLPENKEICEEILQILGNDKVNIKIGDEKSQTSLYVVATNSIFIANIKSTFTRVQTIAHECIHSVQDKRLLWFNFIFSNVYLIYFAVVTILTVFAKVAEPGVLAIILVIMSMMLYFIRSYIENDAMIKARFVAKEYMERKQDRINKKDIGIVVENYDKINGLGIKFYNYKLLFDYLFKIIIYCIIAIIKF